MTSPNSAELIDVRTEQPGMATFARRYAGQASQVRCVRTDLAALLGGCPVADEVLLIVSEFCANAVTHSKSGQPDGSFDVRARIAREDHVRVEVGDDGGAWFERHHVDRPQC